MYFMILRTESDYIPTQQEPHCIFKQSCTSPPILYQKILQEAGLCFRPCATHEGEVIQKVFLGSLLFWNVMQQSMIVGYCCFGIIRLPQNVSKLTTNQCCLASQKSKYVFTPQQKPEVTVFWGFIMCHPLPCTLYCISIYFI